MADLETYLSTFTQSELVAMLASRMRAETDTSTEAKRHDLGGGISLYKQNHSVKWYVRIHSPEDAIEDYRQSTKTSKLEDAKAAAYQIAAALRLKLSEGIPLKKQVTFGTVAKETIKFYSTRNKSNDGYYLSVIRNYLLPAFGDMEILKVNDRAIRLFWNEYTEKQGVPSKTFKTTVHIVLKRILIEAKEQGLTTSLPELSGKVESRRAQTGYWWNGEQITSIFNNLDEWCDNEAKGIFKLYCLFLLKTGCRTGLEALGICWGDIERHKDPKTERVDYYCTIRKGKLQDTRKADRQVLISRSGDDSIVQSKILKVIAEMQGFKGVNDAIDKSKDRRVFELKNQEYLWNTFAKAYDIKGTLYWFRHTHITNRILKREPLTSIATECGTSVKLIELHYGHATTKLFRQNEPSSKRGS